MTLDSSRQHGRLLIGGFADVNDAVRLAKSVSLADPDEVRRQWPEARAAYLRAPCFIGAPSLGPADDSTMSAIHARLGKEPLRSSLSGKNCEILSVRLERLVTSQPQVNVDRVELMRRQLDGAMLSLLFPTETQVSVRADVSDGPSLSFESDRRELCVTQLATRRLAESGAIEVVFRVEPRPNYISVMQIEDRFILRNGNHRLVAAWEAGLREVPCVVFSATRSDLGLKWMKFGLDSLFSDRPPMLIDLVSQSDAHMEVPLRRRRFSTSLVAQQHSSYEQ